ELEREPADLVLVDLHMPVLDGVAMVRRMRATQRLARVPVLLLTADTTADLGAERRTLRIAGLVMKPVDPEELQAACIAAMTMVFPDPEPVTTGAG
ncbi:MAG: response regulator, partial [Pseudomonadota bacterium]